jgi:hypothetical protein
MVLTKRIIVASGGVTFCDIFFGIFPSNASFHTVLIFTPKLQPYAAICERNALHRFGFMVKKL